MRGEFVSGNFPDFLLLFKVWWKERIFMLYNSMNLSSWLVVYLFDKGFLVHAAINQSGQKG